MLVEDIIKYEKDMKGVNLIIYLIGFILIILIGIIKELVWLFITLTRKDNTYYNKYNKKLFYKEKSKNKHVECQNNHMEFYGFLSSTEKHNISDKVTEYIKERDEDLFTKERSKIYNYSKFLRNYLLEHDYCITGRIIKERKPKVILEELVYGNRKEDFTYLIQYIDFGNEINNVISYLFNIKKRKVRCATGSYLIFENGSTIELEEKLKYYFMDRSLKINLV